MSVPLSYFPNTRMQVIVMGQPRRQLFRESALKHYMQKREKDVLPRLISTPMFVGLWVLLFVFIGVGVLVSFGEVAVFANGPGVVLIQNKSAQQGQGTQQSSHSVVGQTKTSAIPYATPATTATPTATASTASAAPSSQEALVVLSALFRTQVHVGQVAWVQIGTKGKQYVGHIAAVDTTVIGPGAVQPQYATSGIAPLLTQPSIVVTVKLDKPMPLTAANLIQARVQLGARRVISLLIPGMNF